ncbi:hypothetical protein [Nocardiopsis lambiniae]|uniref:Tetratricopeptide repeat protein n=1 Tax=Nocardiopsis lambiniae TaxID=3075539 RepID=A0ABU2MCN8_9ACTN|nr:hypothetical protein [Nocardiopsis sp. DSM 44743]MDT0330453.1 hypothetical protein [Nocardiopsis sp. DSM 44743]
MPEPNLPFRWDVERDHTGSLTEPVRPDGTYVDALVECAAKVLARSADRDLYFVGRSPDSLYDLLHGVLADTPHRDRVHRLPLSLYGCDGGNLTPTERAQLRVNLTAQGITPARLVGGGRAIVFCDLVNEGSTFENLHRELTAWADDERADRNRIRGRIGYLGIVAREKTSPNTWRWQQHAPWVEELPSRAVRNVSIPGWLWGFLGNVQPKTEPSFRRTRWADPEVARPRHDERTRAALSAAVALHDRGRDPEVRDAFRQALTADPAFREPWLRTLAHSLRS